MNKQKELNNNIIEYIKYKTPNLIDTTDLVEVSPLIITKIVKTLDKELKKVAKDTCRPYNKVFWIVKQQEIRQVIEVQNIIRKIAQYLVDIDKGNKETKLYKKVEELNSKCNMLLDIIDPM